MTRQEAYKILCNGLLKAPSDHDWAMAFKMAIESLSADMVEVVRCKNCKKYGNPHICPFGKRQLPLENGYCYKGERREDGE